MPNLTGWLCNVFDHFICFNYSLAWHMLQWWVERQTLKIWISTGLPWDYTYGGETELCTQCSWKSSASAAQYVVYFQIHSEHRVYYLPWKVLIWRPGQFHIKKQCLSKARVRRKQDVWVCVLGILVQWLKYFIWWIVNIFTELFSFYPSNYYSLDVTLTGALLHERFFLFK